MGQGQSTTIRDYITSRSTYKTIIENKLNAKTDSSVTTDTKQNMKIEVGGAKCCANLKNCTPFEGPLCDGDVTISQKSTTSQKVYQVIDVKFSEDISIQLRDTMKAEANTAIDNLDESDFTSIFSGKQKQDLKTEISRELDSVFSNKTTFDAIQSSVNNTFNTSDLTINACSKLSGGDCRITQDTSTVITVQNVLTAIVDIIIRNETLVDFYNKITTAVSNTKKGFFTNLIDAVKNFVSSPTFMIVAIVIVIALILGGLAYIAMR